MKAPTLKLMLWQIMQVSYKTKSKVEEVPLISNPWPPSWLKMENTRETEPLFLHLIRSRILAKLKKELIYILNLTGTSYLPTSILGVIEKRPVQSLTRKIASYSLQKRMMIEKKRPSQPKLLRSFENTKPINR